MRPATRWRDSVSIPGRQALVRGPHLGDVLALGELVRERLDAGIPDPPQLLAPVAKDVGEFQFFSHVLRVSGSKQVGEEAGDPSERTQYVSEGEDR